MIILMTSIPGPASLRASARSSVSTMSSALSYYTSKNRATERLENKRNEISRSSAYIIDNSSSNRSSYSSYGGDSRTSRSTYRDRSLDFSARAR